MCLGQHRGRSQYLVDARTQARVLNNAELCCRDIQNGTLDVVTVRLSVLRITASKRLPVDYIEIRVRAAYRAPCGLWRDKEDAQHGCSQLDYVLTP